MGTLATILKDNWKWREQIVQLALFDIKKKSRGAVLGWAWFFIKPSVYAGCFWFALEIGLKAAKFTVGDGAPPYILWLVAGIFPWQFMSGMLGSGIDVLHRYPYLVNKIKFPLSAISSLYTLSETIIEALLILFVFIISLVCGQVPDVYLLQVPILLVLLFVFWNIVSIGMSQLSAISKDFKNLMVALTTPIFWMSGVIFNVKMIDIDWLQTALLFNPVTFFVTGFRDAFFDKVWFWEDPAACIGFAIVFVVTLVFTLVVYRRFNEEVADVL